VLGRSGRRWAFLALVVLVAVTSGAMAESTTQPRPRPPNRFGIAAGGALQTLPSRDLARTLDGIRALGATWIRFDINWAVIQDRGRSSYHWGPFDRVVRAARARGLNVLAGILYTPPWARPSGGSASSPPAKLEEYAAFARKAAARYRRLGVHAYEIWNEPNNADSWEPAPDAARYTQMLRLAYAAIKRVDRKATVISAGLSPYGSRGAGDSRHLNPLDFLERMYASEARGSMDAVGWHPYTFPRDLGFSDSSGWSQMAETTPSARSIMVAYGDGAKRIWPTEFGAPTGASSVSLTEAAQAELVSAAYTKLKAWRWAGPAFLYNYRDQGAVDPGASADGGFGLVRADWSKKPSYRAYERLAKKSASLR